MSKRTPKSDMLKSFLTYLRDEQDLTLLGNSVFKDSSRWVKVPPRMVTPFFIFLLYPSTIHPKDNHLSTILGRFKPLLGRNNGKKNKNM